MQSCVRPALPTHDSTVFPPKLRPDKQIETNERKAGLARHCMHQRLVHAHAREEHVILRYAYREGRESLLHEEGLILHFAALMILSEASLHLFT